MTDEKKAQDKRIKTGSISDTKKEPVNQESIKTSGSKKDEKKQIDNGVTSETNLSQDKSDQTSNNHKKPKRPVKMKKSDISSFENFIAYSYQLKGRKMSLNGKTQKQISEGLTLSEEAKQSLNELVCNDTLLLVPRQLLLAAREFSKYPRLKIATFSFVRDVLLQHPLFLRSEIEAAVRSDENAPEPNVVLKSLANSSKYMLKDQKGMNLKDAEFDKLRCNAVKCMAVWLFEKKELSIPAITDALYQALWEKRAKRLKGDNAKLTALTETGDFTSVGLACSDYREQAIEDRKSADEATRDANILRDKVIELEDEIDSSNEAAAEIETEHKTEKESFINEIANLKNRAENDAAHLRDDLDKLRTKVLRRLKADAALLEDGLQALRRSEPKVHVMVDISERVTDALRNEIKKLEEGD